MRTTNFLGLLSLLMLTTLSVSAQRGARIGYVDMEYILESVPEYQEAATMLDGRVQRWKKDIERMSKEIDQMKLNLANERVLLTPELIEEREEEIQIKEEEMLTYQQNRFGPGGDLDIQRGQLVQPIQDQVFNIVQELAEARKYDFIMDRATDPSMLFAAKRNDLSEQVLRQINRAAKREEAQSRKDKEEIEERDALSLEQDKELTQREEEAAQRQADREEAAQQKKDDREAILAERKRVRDSIRAARQAEFEARRQQLIEERQRRKDSIEQARKNKTNPPDGDDGSEGTDNQ